MKTRRGFSVYALELYQHEGVGAACLDLQTRLDVDVNLVLVAAYVGAIQRRELTAREFQQLCASTSQWHSQVVQPLRAVRQRLRDGPAPAPNDASHALRQKLISLELDCEIIELDVLEDLLQDATTNPSHKPTEDLVKTCIDVVLAEHSSTITSPDDQAAANVIARASTSIALRFSPQ